MSLRWLSFADPNRPEGEQYLGAVIIDAPDFLTAVKLTHWMQINPGGEVVEFGCDPAKLEERVSASHRGRLLSRADLDGLFDDMTSLADIAAGGAQ